MTTKPLLCIVTDRLRLARAQGRPPADACELLLRQVEGAVAAGVEFVQIRERDLEGRTLAQLVTAAVALTRSSTTRIIVNDRVDVAVVSGAPGVHLPERSMPAAAVRRLAPALIVGRSVHSAAAVGAGEAVDYFVAGTVFPTDSKSRPVRPIGVAGLRQIVAAAGSIPVLAIGGVTVHSAAALARAGIAGVAAIGAFVPSQELDDVRLTVQKSATALRFAFDSNSTVS